MSRVEVTLNWIPNGVIKENLSFAIRVQTNCMLIGKICIYYKLKNLAYFDLCLIL